jgi:hypothetical protein
MIETRAEDELRQLAPLLIGGGRAFFTEEHLKAAFPGSKNCDAGIDFGGDVVLAEIVSGTVKVPTRELADASAFRLDAEKIVIRKARQLYETAANLLRNPQSAASPLSAPPGRIFPVVVIGGQFPVNPLTVRYISEQLAAEGHRPGGTVQPLAVLDLEELEGCHALWQRRNQTLSQLLDAWRNSPYRDAAFRNYLSHVMGGRELGRPDDVQQALAQSFIIIQQHLGIPGQWTPPDELHDQVTRQPETSPEPASANRSPQRDGPDVHVRPSRDPAPRPPPVAGAHSPCPGATTVRGGKPADPGTRPGRGRPRPSLPGAADSRCWHPAVSAKSCRPAGPKPYPDAAR